ncbi:GNAT family N-acetyltransferase [Pannus brasiliensis CCIBt3594]|uniref:GNAT family N-acetyltransferase n=1 Tax=Pannus brasiliensis CCIBt3594 TaxID=1427578 RepID=A0AAW9QXV4_9CHRO
MSVTIRQVAYTEEIVAIQAIRREVFQEEQGVPAELEFDGLDEDCWHLLAYFGKNPVGTARIRNLDKETAKIERLAVLKSARGSGIGRRLMERAIDLASNNPDTSRVVINAQEYVKGLYEKLGFEVVGDRFDEAGIPHVKMVRVTRAEIDR